VSNQGQNFGTNNFEGSGLFAVDYKLLSRTINFVMSHKDTALQTSLFLNLVTLKDKLMVDKNTSDNSNVAQHAKVSKNVSVSAYQRLGLVSDPKSNVSISGKVGRSQSRSRLELEVKRLGLGPQRLVYISA